MSKFAVILAAAGKSTRFGDPFKNKVYATISGKPLWMYAAEKFSSRDDVGQILIAISPDDKDFFNEKFAGNAAMLGIQAVLGGAQRADSVRNALGEVREDLSYVAVHDAARPCIADRWIDSVFQAAQKSGAAILATPCSSTLKRVGANSQIVETVSRDGVWLAQTPQVFRKDLLKAAYEQHPDPGKATDEASLVEGLPAEIRQKFGTTAVSVVEGSPLNIKVTTKSDLKFAELAVKVLPKPNPFPFG
ncbi:MAG: 2-C-methyl-D-erythritol 4-phosphate cytidylyltransferase [bacterium]|nr:2-C-methyl-D-erythritol 4-phosphate cytidylyltransferase [bacterium]